MRARWWCRRTPLHPPQFGEALSLVCREMFVQPTECRKLVGRQLTDTRGMDGCITYGGFAHVVGGALPKVSGNLR